MFHDFFPKNRVHRGMVLVSTLVTLLPGLLLAHPGEIQQAVVASSCASAASRWIESLDAEQRKLAVWSFDEAKRRDWHYLNNLPPIYMRKEGLAFKAMSSGQRILGHQLMRCGLSSQGYQKATGIMILESIGWGQLPDKGIEAAKKLSDTVGTMDAYWLAVFGDPTSGQPWQWQMEGHHVALNFTFVGDAVAVTPTFLGTRPNVILEGEYAGWHALGYEKTRAFDLLTSLSPAQLSKAVIADEVANNIFTDPERLDVFDSFAGLPARDMDAQQQALLWRVIYEYVLNYEHEISQQRLAEIEADGIENIYFAWMGPTDTGSAIYYRIHGPGILIEFDHGLNVRAPKLGSDPNHIHSIVRVPGGDFGDDLLRRHYEESPDHQ